MGDAIRMKTSARTDPKSAMQAASLQHSSEPECKNLVQ
jgi:hypothetical protein